MNRYFTKTKVFVGQDLNDLSKARTCQPNEYWIVWPGWTAKYEPDPPEREEEFRGATEEEFRKFDAGPDAVQHVSISTARACGVPGAGGRPARFMILTTGHWLNGELRCAAVLSRNGREYGIQQSRRSDN